ncbi:alcohol dehydrogenase [Clohesyomyces aquaticus]|uniref:Alcohol dehydrogenase n=1 Tax=Clohesyomyces aquaticus TaxID=1231657 RepID=A0A1Y1ZP38_9PLEO|nr:alcohol dehydrogenase [Clohesyomyces aquaticus]
MSSPTPLHSHNNNLPTARRVWRRTDDHTPGAPKVRLVIEDLPPLGSMEVLIKVHAISLNYRDANIANGGNPWPVTPHGIPCNDAAGSILAVGAHVKSFGVGDRVAPNTDTENITGRESQRSWLAADEDGVLADYLIFSERVLAVLPSHLPWIQASILPCAGVTAWSALKDITFGQSVLIQGTGGVAMFAVKLARAAGLKVVLSSSSDKKLADVVNNIGEPPIKTVNYATSPDWHEEVLRFTDRVGVDCVVEVGGTASIIRSIQCTRRGGIVSVVGYLSKDEGVEDMKKLLPLLIDRRVSLRGVNAGSVKDMEDLCQAVTATQMTFEDIIDSTMEFERAEEAIQYIWEGMQVGKLVITV